MYYIRIIVGIYHNKILLLMSFIITLTKCTGLKKKKKKSAWNEKQLFFPILM